MSTSVMLPLLFLAGSPGPLELLVIFGVVLVLFGPRKLPGIARSIGRMLHELRKASDEFRSQVMSIEDASATPTDAVAEESAPSAADVPSPESTDAANAACDKEPGDSGGAS